MKQVLAATLTNGEAGNKWFQGTADAVRRFSWVFEVGILNATYIYAKFTSLVPWNKFVRITMQDAKNKNIEHILIISGDHLCRMDYMKLVEVQIR